MLKEKIQNDLRGAMKNKEELKLSTLRMLSTALTNKEIEKKKRETGLTDEEIIEIIQSEIKKRQDAMESYTEGGRQELADKEAQEAEILKTYLPEPLSDEELKSIIEKTITEVGASKPQDMGKVMGKIIPQVKGRADVGKLSQIVKEILAG